MSTHTSTHTPAAMQVVPWDIFADFMGKFDKLEQEVGELKAALPEWVDTKEALRITNLKCGDTLKRLREQSDSLIIVKKEGKKVSYQRASLVAHNESKVRRAIQPGRNLLA